MRFFFCCIVICLASLTYGQDVTDGLIAHYSFDDCQNLGKEESGNNQAAVIVGDPQCVCGVSGNALLLDGIDDYLLFLGTMARLIDENISVNVVSCVHFITFNTSLNISVQCVEGLSKFSKLTELDFITLEQANNCRSSVCVTSWTE